jgi:hypothetical protein
MLQMTTHSECVIFIAFPWQQWLCECSSVLLYSTLPVLLDICVVVTSVFFNFFNLKFREKVFKDGITKSQYIRESLVHKHQSVHCV